MNLESIVFMTDNSTSNNINNYDSNLNMEDSDYKNLIAKLKEVKQIIALLEKTIFE